MLCNLHKTECTYDFKLNGMKTHKNVNKYLKTKKKKVLCLNGSRIVSYVSVHTHSMIWFRLRFQPLYHMWLYLFLPNPISFSSREIVFYAHAISRKCSATFYYTNNCIPSTYPIHAHTSLYTHPLIHQIHWYAKLTPNF